MKNLITLLGVAAAGSILYVNAQKKRDLTLDNLRLSARELFGTAKRRAVEVKDREKQIVHDAASKVVDATEVH